MRAKKGEIYLCAVCREVSKETAGFSCKHRLMLVEEASVVTGKDGYVTDCQAVASSTQAFRAAPKI